MFDEVGSRNSSHLNGFQFKSKSKNNISDLKNDFEKNKHDFDLNDDES